MTGRRKRSTFRSRRQRHPRPLALPSLRSLSPWWWFR